MTRTASNFIVGGALTVLFAVAACATDVPDVPHQVAAKRVHPDCLGGFSCGGNPADLTVALVGDSVILADSSNYDSDSGYAYFTTNYNADSLLYWYDYHISTTWSVQNNTDTVVNVTLSAGASCSNDCVVVATHYPGTDPGSLSLDPSEKEYVTVNFSTNAPGTGTVFLSAGPTTGDAPARVHHITPHPPVF